MKLEPVQKNHIKSQVVDDVLEILIKNGELPPSAAQDPATPTTPNRQLPQNLVFTASADNQNSQPILFTAASPISPISPVPMEVSQNGVSSPASSPAPPPPPPLPLTSFSVQLPSVLHEQQQQDDMSFSNGLLSSESDLDAAMLLSPQSVQQGSPDSQPSQEINNPDNANLDLKVCR